MQIKTAGLGQAKLKFIQDLAQYDSWQSPLDNKRIPIPVKQVDNKAMGKANSETNVQKRNGEKLILKEGKQNCERKE